MKNIPIFHMKMQACELLGCRIDYLATHDYTGVADQVMDKLEMLYNRFIAVLI